MKKYEKAANAAGWEIRQGDNAFWNYNTREQDLEARTWRELCERHGINV